MKSISLLTTLFILSLFLSCQEGEFTDAPGATDAPEKTTKNSEQEDELNDDDDENEVEISLADLPQSISEDIASRFPSAELIEADRVTNPDGSIIYDVQFKHDGKIMEAMYTAEGVFQGLEEEGLEEEGPEEESDDDDDI